MISVSSVPPNLDESSLNTAMLAVKNQESWCPKLKDIPHYELQTLLSIAIRAFLTAGVVSPKPAARPNKPKGPAKTDSKRTRVLQRDKYICYLCNKLIPEVEASIDHVIPKARGGKNGFNNLRAAHKDCNFRKGDMSLSEYRALYPIVAA